jgi:hypothetical protein
MKLTPVKESERNNQREEKNLYRVWESQGRLLQKTMPYASRKVKYNKN